MSDPQRYLTWRDRLLGAVCVVVALYLHLRLMGQATNLLSLGLVIAYGLWACIRWKNEPAAILPVYLLGLSIQCLHFCEEYVTGFQQGFRALFGYRWSDRQFVVFNLVWLSIFVLAALGVSIKTRLAYLIVFFFALIGGIGNGIGHLVICIIQQRYFSGSLTAPFCLIVGVTLMARLLGR
ncbi:MAG: HXXEE domain-containing protein [Acidobacteriia bacterium]|nr:HXXEE domain-containing protein [Terriglobia bacterium]